MRKSRENRRGNPIEPWRNLERTLDKTLRNPWINLKKNVEKTQRKPRIKPKENKLDKTCRKPKEKFR